MPRPLLHGAVILLLGVANGVAAQRSTPPLQHWQHAMWNGENGPPPARFHPMLKGPDGYLWLGGENSLVRFDGSSYTVFDSASSPLLRSAVAGPIAPLLVAPDSSIWLSRPDEALVAFKMDTFL